QVIVRALVEAVDPVFDGVFSGEDQHWRIDAALAQRGEDVNAVAPRQHEIEKHQVKRLRVGEEESFFAGRCDGDLEALGLEPFTQRLRNLALILDDENPHRAKYRERGYADRALQKFQ